MFVKIAGRPGLKWEMRRQWKDMNIVIRWCFCAFACKGWAWSLEIIVGF